MVDSVGEKRVLAADVTHVTDVDLIQRPPYYGLVSSDGKPLQSIGVSCGNHGVSFFINSYCEYFSRGEQCKFCGLVPTQKKFSDTVKMKKAEQVRECMEGILRTNSPIEFVQFSGGSLYDHDAENRQYLTFIRTVREALENNNLTGKVPIHLTCMPPHDMGILGELKDAGLDTISFDMECTTPEFFEKYCPGKTKTQGYSGMRSALRKANEVFGHGNAFTILIAGIEPRETFIGGLRDIMDDGIVPTINIYHNDPLCSSDMDVGDPDVEELIEMAYDAAGLFKQMGAVPGKLGCAHYDIGHEIRKGYFDA